MTQPAPTGPGRDGPAPEMPDIDGPVSDYSDGTLSPALHNLVFDYSYTKGNVYRLSFNDSFGVTFQMFSDGSEARGPLPYKCRELREDQYLVTWHVRQFGIHVSLVIDLAAHTICVAALMPPGSWEFWDISTDVKISRAEPAPAA